MAFMPAMPPTSLKARAMEITPKIRMMGTAKLLRMFIHLVPLRAVIVMPRPPRMAMGMMGRIGNSRCAESPISQASMENQPMVVTATMTMGTQVPAWPKL